MTDPSPLRRKIGAISAAPTAQDPTLDHRRFWRRAFVHGLMRSIKLDLQVEDVAIAPIEIDDVIDLTGPQTLNLYLDGPNGYAVAILEADVAMSVIEIQTLGKVLRRRSEPRAMTSTDAAMVADPLDQVLAAHEALIETPGGAEDGGLRYAAMIAEPRQIPLNLGDGDHDHVRLALNVGGEAARKGHVHLVVPRPRLPPPPASDPDEGWDARLAERLMGSEVRVVAELARLELDVSEVQALAVGDLLPLPRRTLGTVRLLTATGAMLGNARLGKSDGRKAVRLEDAVPPDFAEAAPRSEPHDGGATLLGFGGRNA